MKINNLIRLAKACLKVKREEPDARHWMDPLEDLVSYKSSSIYFLKIQGMIIWIAESKVQLAQKALHLDSLRIFCAVLNLVIGRDNAFEIKEFRVRVLRPAVSCTGGQE